MEFLRQEYWSKLPFPSLDQKNFKKAKLGGENRARWQAYEKEILKMHICIERDRVINLR